VRHLLSLAAAVEINILLLAAILCFVFRGPKIAATPFLLFCLFFSLSVLLMIGYTVNILGAIVRYRSIALILLLLPIYAQANWKRIGQIFSGNGNSQHIQ
jgi:hypothetical protein